MAERNVVLICGSQTWTSYGPIFDLVAGLPAGTLIVHGGARGADSLAEKAAEALGVHTAVVRPRWKAGGRSAGHIRNAVMLDLTPSHVYAFTMGTPGTRGCLKDARRRGIPTTVKGRDDA